MCFLSLSYGYSNVRHITIILTIYSVVYLLLFNVYGICNRMTTDTFIVIIGWPFLVYCIQTNTTKNPFIDSYKTIEYVLLVFMMRILVTTLLALVSFTLVCPVNTLHFDDHPFNKTKSMVSSATYNGRLNIGEKEKVSHYQNRTWFVENKTGKCECADYLDGIIICDANSNEVFISSQLCMSYDKHRGEEVVGRCPYIYTSFSDLNTTNVGLFVKLPSIVNKLEHIFCDHLNREGYFVADIKSTMVTQCTQISSNV